VSTVAIPGTLCAPSLFDRLAARTPLSTVDWMASGRPADIPALASRIAGDRPEPSVVLGHSTGGAIALQLALEHPAAVAGLMLVDTGASMAGHGDVDGLLTMIRTQWGPALWRGLLDRSFASPPDEQTMTALLDYAGGCSAEVTYEVLASQRVLDFTPRLAEIAVPVTVVHGEFDRARPVEHAQRLAGGIPGARLHVLPTGHSPVYEAPEAVAALLAELHERT
jgi:pimeloyl-ACP methyl ester carboxylesterase